MKGLFVQVSGDGVWLRFDSSSGKTALINVETIAQIRPPSVAEALQDWIVDRKKELA
jgi:hypothetical protein